MRLWVCPWLPMATFEVVQHLLVVGVALVSCKFCIRKTWEDVGIVMMT